MLPLSDQGFELGDLWRHFSVTQKLFFFSGAILSKLFQIGVIRSRFYESVSAKI
jgi:hypothetical protein